MPVVDALALAGRVLHNPQPAVRGFSGETFSGFWFREPAYVRLYLRDPNYMKTNFPDVAKRIRESVNSNPNLKDGIQFNTAGESTGDRLPVWLRW